MKSAEKSLSVILCTACLALLLQACDRSNPVETVPAAPKVEVIAVPSEATVISVSGPVSIKKRQSPDYIPLLPQHVIETGDLMELRKGGSLELRFMDGTVAVMEAGTRDRRIKFEQVGQKAGPPPDKR